LFKGAAAGRAVLFADREAGAREGAGGAAGGALLSEIKV
jgi:hypothetical protein